MNVAVNAQNVFLKLNHKHVISNLSFKIPKGSITLISGDNGIGKSITLKLIAQLVQPTKGDIQTKGRIAYAPDKFPNHLKMKVHTFLEIIQNLNQNNDHNWKEYSKSFNLTPFEKDKLNQISKGTLQKVNIIQALLTNGEVLIFDEPFNGLDKQAEMNFISLLKKLSKTKTIILTSHESHIVQSFTTHELNLHNGNFQTISTNRNFKSITFLTSENTATILPQVIAQKIYNQHTINHNSIKIYIDSNDTNIILNNLIKHSYKILEVKDE